MSPDDVMEHPAYRALRRHAMACERCALGARCPTGEALTETLDNLQRGEVVSR